MFFVYLLRSLKDKDYYIGQTDNIDERVSQHNNGLVESTKSRRPLALIGYETYNTRSQAITREQNLKKHSDRKRQFIKKLSQKDKRLST